MTRSLLNDTTMQKLTMYVITEKNKNATKLNNVFTSIIFEKNDRIK